MFTFVEHIRKLTVKFICLFQLWLPSRCHFSSLEVGTLRIFLLTNNVLVDVSWIICNITNQVVYIYIMLLLYISLNFILRDSNFDLSLLLAKVGRKILRTQFRSRSHPRHLVGKRTAQNKPPLKTSSATAR